MKSFKSFLVLLLLAACAAGGYFYFDDTAAPQITVTPAGGNINRASEIRLHVEDGSGVARLAVTVLQNGRQFQLLKREYPANTVTVDEVLELNKLRLIDGEVVVQVEAGDAAVYHLGKGNRGSRVCNYVRDTRPPLITVLSNAHNMTVGGSALVVYSVGEEVKNSGVQLGKYFFPGYRQSDGRYLCLFAFPYDVDLDTVPRVVARDNAGNKGVGGFYYHLRKHRFRVDTINVSDGFLNSKMPQFQDMFPQAQSPLEVFLAVNRQLRPQNRAFLHQLAANSAAEFTWSNERFIRQPGAATRATFGDLRHYKYKGKEIDQQRHLGIDLASVARSKVPASNSGTVIFADFLGIYGQCIVIDHGLGLQTLYAHLSSINVQVGEQVQRGQIIARTGATGLAGGDHLHFGVIVGGVPVNPVEWWDKHWVHNNITSKLNIRAE